MMPYLGLLVTNHSYSCPICPVNFFSCSPVRLSGCLYQEHQGQYLPMLFVSRKLLLRRHSGLGQIWRPLPFFFQSQNVAATCWAGRSLYVVILRVLVYCHLGTHLKATDCTGGPYCFCNTNLKCVMYMLSLICWQITYHDTQIACVKSETEYH